MSTLLSSDEALQKHNLGRGREGGGVGCAKNDQRLGREGEGCIRKMTKELTSMLHV